MAPKTAKPKTATKATTKPKATAKSVAKPAAKPVAKAAEKPAPKPAPVQKRKAPTTKETAVKKNKPAAKKAKVPEKVVEPESESEDEESSMFTEEIAAAEVSSDEGVDSSEDEEEIKATSKPTPKAAFKVEEESEEEVDESQLLQGIDSSEGEDSSDEESDLENTIIDKDEFTDNKPHIALDPKDEAKLKQKLDQLEKKAHTQKVDTGVIYLGRIPHGFYEEEMRSYFGQFGTVTRLRLSRNKKTGKSKHYAFIEFKSKDVAEIVADTMNNYLLYGHLLKCKVIPEDKLHPKLFDGANKKFKVIPWNKIAREEHNKPKTRESRNRVVKKLLKKEAKTRAKLQELGIDYEFPGYTGDVKPKSKRIVFDN